MIAGDLEQLQSDDIQLLVDTGITKFQQLQRFYSRNASSKYQLDVYESRDAFLASTAIAERVDFDIVSV